MPKDHIDTESPLSFRKPEAEDGSAIWELVKRCAPLDENSMYCNLLQCDHFSDTCVLVEKDNQPVGWISAYVLPSEPDTLFVWQVAVAPEGRGQGLGKRMLTHILERDDIAEIARLKTTITKDNDASWGLFRSFADEMGGQLSSEPHYKTEEHFDGAAKTEHLVTISLAEPLKSAA